MMNSSRVVTIFSELPVDGNGPSGLVVSALLHLVAFGVLLAGLRTTLRERDVAVASQYSVRVLELHRREPQMRKASTHGTTSSAAKSNEVEEAAGGEKPELAYPQMLAPKVPARQTLIQPDLTARVVLREKVPLPTVLLWKAESTPVKMIVPEPPMEVMAAHVRPSIERPNHEVRPADVKISATAFQTKAPALPPSTTSPIAINVAVASNHVPETTSTLLGQPSSAMVMSISDLHQDEGRVTIPQANQMAANSTGASLGAGRNEKTARGGSGSGSGAASGDGKGMAAVQGAGDKGETASTGSGPAGERPGSGSSRGDADQGSGPGGDAAVIRINVPKDGQFGMVVVGSSLAEEYPETVGLWNSRLAYTVYLHMGLSKSWILQYSLPADVDPAGGGNVTRPEAPWPYAMVRPKVAPSDFNADAIMIHGFVNVAGKFDKMSVVFPLEFADKKVLLSALQEWRFRPAKQNGQQTEVEVLLIIPEEAQ